MSPRVGWFITSVVGAILLTSAPAHAQDAVDRFFGKPITAVELQVEGRPDTSAPLLAYIDIKPGEPFTIETYRRVADRFNQVPRFQAVRVLADERPTGLVLIFDLEPRHPIDRMEFPGSETGLPESDLQRLVRDRFSGLPAFTRVSEVEDVVRRILEEEGFKSASVIADLQRFHDPDRSTLNVTIRAGERTTIRSIKVVGQSPFSTEEILERLEIAVGAPYRDRELLASIAKLRDDLRGKGYYTANPDYEATTDGAHVDLVLTVESGPIVRLIVKGDGLPGSEDDYIPIKRQGSVDQDLLYDSRLVTERDLRRQGYWRATVQYATEQTPEERIITFTITRGKRYRIDRVILPAGLHVTQADLAGIKELKAGEWFSEEAVYRALLALAAIYQQDGYYQVKLDPKYDDVAGRSDQEGAVAISPNIVEGPRAFITGITFDLGPDATIREADLRGIMKSKQLTPPAPYAPANLIFDREALPAYYDSQGFLDHKLEIVPEFNAAGTEAILHVKAVEGLRVVVGEITVVGNDRVSRESILRELTLQVGQPYSEAARFESQRRLYNMGFRSAVITAQSRLPGEAETRIVVSVVETGSITFGFGGGIEGGTTARNVPGGGIEDRLEFSPRGSIDVGRRNLGGHNRSVNFFARVSLKPRNSDDPELDGKGFGFTEYRVSGTFQERYAFRSNSDVLLGVSSEQAVRETYSYLRRGVTADFVRPLPRAMTLSTRYAFEITRVFDARLSEEDQSLIDRLFPQVRLSILSGTILRDRRDNQAAPSSGSLITAGMDFAPRWLGSEVAFVKSTLQGSFYRAIREDRRFILAGRATLGLARGFERSVAQTDENGEPILDPGGNPIIDVVADLPASQRFFAGGSNTVRGFAQDRLGATEILNENGLSNGGNAMMYFNAELRMATGRPFGRSLTTVVFTDAGNVFDRAGDLDLGRLRPSAGFGFRYDSPLGPLRVDLGYKLDKYIFPNATERRWEIHISLFEVF